MYSRIISLVFGLLVIIGAAAFLVQNPPPRSPSFTKGGGWGEDFQKRGYVSARIGSQTFYLRVADDAEERERGLSGTPALAPNGGVLFVFPDERMHAIWMKGMLIPIDILWISASSVVIDLREDVSPDSFPAIFAPASPARFVVELSAGAAKAFGIKVGDKIEFLGE